MAQSDRARLEGKRERERERERVSEACEREMIGV